MKKKAYLILQAVLYTALAVMTASAVIRIWCEGAGRRAAGDSLAWIFTRKTLAEALAPVLPVLIAAAVSTVAGLLLNIRGETVPRPDPGLRPQGGRIRLRERTAAVVRMVLLAAALAMILAGVLNGGMRDVLIKAINLCTECVGLG